jgi:HK97 gp10 family phage protein
MAKMTIGKGMDEYLAKLGNLEFAAPGLVGQAIYEGAKVVADQIRANIEALPTVKNKRVATPRDPTQVEIDGMLAGLGIAKKKNDSGYINVKIGMDGYNTDVTEKYPRGKPNAMIARSIESGSTVMKQNKFITRAVNKTKKEAEAAMKKVIEEGIEKIMK